MKIYKVTLQFTNLDNSLYTDAQAAMFFEIQADDTNHAYLLGEHLKQTFQADSFLID